MPAKLRLNRGQLLLQRLGTLTPKKQGYWKRAPTSQGLWAFPWPYFSMFFAAHQYAAIAPRRFTSSRNDPAPPPPELPDTGREASRLHDYEYWHRNVAPRVLPIRRFWYDGEVYTHLDPKGHDLGFFEWRRVDVCEFTARARRFLTQQSRWPTTRTPIAVGSFQIEAMELFIPTRAQHFEPARGPKCCPASRARARRVDESLQTGSQMLDALEHFGDELCAGSD